MKKTDLMLIMFFAIFALLLNFANGYELYEKSADGNLYLSVADNFLSTGHLIQTDRVTTPDMVVPFGLPVILILLRFFTTNIFFIICFQYLLLGIACYLLYDIFSKKTKFALLAPIVFLFEMFTYRSVTPSFILTETYFLLFIILFIHLLFNENQNKIRQLNYLLLVSFFGYFIRPTLLPLIIVSVGLVVIEFFTKKIPLISFRKSAIIVVAVLSINTFINYIETGNIVILQNYSGIPLYSANNSNTKTYEYNSHKLDQFVDDKFYAVYENEELTFHEKNHQLSNETKKFVFENKLFTAKNTVIKYYNFFIKDSLIVFVSLIVMAVLTFFFSKSITKSKYSSFIIAGIGITLLTSMGLYIDRYGVIFTPFKVIIIFQFLILLESEFKRRLKI